MMRDKYLMIEFDLAGAEWVVVAYLSQDPNMLEVIRSGISPHIVTGSLIAGCSQQLVAEDHKIVGSATDPGVIAKAREALDFPKDIFLPRSMSIRQAGKKSNHGLNYDMRYRRFALENEMLERDAEPIVNLYRNKAYPRIFDTWHPAIRKELQDNDRCLTNCFGRKVRLLNEWGQELFMAAYAFKPQSTVFDCVRAGMIAAFADPSFEFAKIEMGAQVHDSIMFNHPVPETKDEWIELSRCVWRFSQIYMRPLLTYNDVDFRLGCDAKMGLSWGRLKTLAPITQDLDALSEAMQALYDAVASEEGTLDHLDQEAPEWEPMQMVTEL